MNSLKSILFLYFIIRDTGTAKTPIISFGFMRQTGPPWKTGKGLQLRFKKYVLQIGVCRPNRAIKEDNEESGLLYAMQGRLLDESPKEIRNW